MSRVSTVSGVMPSLPPLSSLASWRTLALLFALVNLKSLPLAWHVRVFYRMFRSWYSKKDVERTLKKEGAHSEIHPIFQPSSIYSRAPLLETDYNLHKSNSTYFGDLDESRALLVTKFVIPAMKQGNAELEKEGHKGPSNVILGSVHTTFHREIKPYEQYEVRSKILGWDRKWLVVQSWFVRPGKKEVLLASALSKYVIKKGKFTVSPEWVLTLAGWLPPRPEGVQSTSTSLQASSEEPSVVPTPQEGLTEPIPANLAATTENLVESLEGIVQKTSPASGASVGGWDWHRIEAQRIRGLQLAANWVALDKDLMDTFPK